MQPEDSQGSPDQAPGLAKRLVDQADVVGVVGPAFSGESATAGPTFAEAGLPTITPSATAVDLSENGWDDLPPPARPTTTCRVPASPRYIKDTIKPTKVGVIDDASDLRQGPGRHRRASELGAAVAVTDTIDPEGSDYSAAVTKVNDAGADTVFFGGYYEAAGRLSKQLRDAGFEGQLVFGDGVKDAGYIERCAATPPRARSSPAPCAPAEALPNGADFVAAYTEATARPGTYAAEAYDAANVLPGRHRRRQHRTASRMLDLHQRPRPIPGITKEIKFDDDRRGQRQGRLRLQGEGGEIVGEGEIE